MVSGNAAGFLEIGFTFLWEKVESQSAKPQQTIVVKERKKMKKLTRSDGWEDSPLVSSKSFDAEFDELDEEIIELDDEIIELPANGSEDDEGPAFDVEILDAERQLDLKGSEGKIESEEEFLLDDDLLKELPFFQDQPTESEPAKSEAATRVEPEPPPSAAEAQPEPEPELDVAALAPELFSDTSETVPDFPAAPQVSAPAAPVTEAVMAAAVSSPREIPAEPETSLEDFLTQIESRLLESVRELVEARLPEIVRVVLREEIERLQTDRPSE